MKRNIVLLDDTPEQVASYLCHRFLGISYYAKLDTINLTRVSGELGGNLISKLNPHAFVNGGIDNSAVLQIYANGELLREVQRSKPDFGSENPILLSYVDGGIRNASVLQVELYDEEHREANTGEVYEVKPADIIVFGIAGGINNNQIGKVRIAIPNALEIAQLSKEKGELETRLDKVNARLTPMTDYAFLKH